MALLISITDLRNIWNWKKTLRCLCRTYYRQQITMMACTLGIIDLFHELKASINSSTVLYCFEPNKLTFLKTDWSAEGMVWILMQPTDDKESQKATTHLKNTVECLFDLYKHGARLKPVVFGYPS